MLPTVSLPDRTEDAGLRLFARRMVCIAFGNLSVALMPRTPADDAWACCERLRAAFHAEAWDRIAPGLRLTVSIGVVSADDAGDLDGLERDADDRLYAAKRAGRDRAVAGP